MRLCAQFDKGQGLKRVIVIGFLYEGENLKAIYIDDEGAVDAADASGFTIEDSEILVLK